MSVAALLSKTNCLSPHSLIEVVVVVVVVVCYENTGAGYSGAVLYRVLVLLQVSNREEISNLTIPSLFVCRSSISQRRGSVRVMQMRSGEKGALR